MTYELNRRILSDVLRRKEEARKEIRTRSFGEKIAMVEAMRERLAPFKKLREQRRAEREQSLGPM